MRAVPVAIAVIAALVLAGPAAAKPRERIVVLAPHLAELVCAVEACDDLVAVVEHTDAPPAAARLPKVGSAYSVNLEGVLALRPTRVLAWDGGTPAATITRLRALGLTVDTIRIRDLDAIATALETIARSIGKAEVGVRAAREYRQRLDELRQRYRDRPRLRAFYQIDSGPAYTVNRDSPITAALSLCGADNVFASLPTISAVVSAEAVLAADPEVLVYTSFEDPRAIAAYWSRLKTARAADPKRQVVVDAEQITRQSPRVLDGIAALCSGLDRVRSDLRRDAR